MPFYSYEINKISLILFVDEVSFTKSGNNNRMYAILCQIAELPEIVRSAYRNIVPLVFFDGPQSNFNSLFRNFLTQLNFYTCQKFKTKSKENSRIYRRRSG